MSQLSLFARRAALAAAGVGVVLAGSVALARAAEPVRIGVIAPTSAIDGRSIMQGAEMAADEINAAGGVDGRPIKLYKYDDHASAADGVRAFQRATKQNHAVAVIGNFTSEVALATEPWAARLKEPYIVTGASTTKINERIRNDYAHYKYVFRDTLNSVVVGKIVCGYAKDILVKDLGYKTAAIMSENADWTKPLDKEYQKCLPKAGLKVVDHIRFDPNTNDFSPIFSRIERAKPDVIITGIAHVGVKPTVQWHQNQIPMMFAGWSSQAGASSFWKSTNGAAEDTITGNVASGGAALTPKTIPFIKKYEKRFGESPAYNAYSTYDALYILKNAIERAHSTKPDALVKALEKTDYVGVQGREQFYARHARFAHGLRYGPGYLTGVAIQWQAGKQVVIWPKKAANGQVQVPDFVKHAGNG
ncbi:MAG TPA: ABC transporter substrate-binding protein [Gammaproteobacteria bacterium]|nr:ABC transporter substrate-binding protein [Gammaproteobacteria bacterium]